MGIPTKHKMKVACLVFIALSCVAIVHGTACSWTMGQCQSPADACGCTDTQFQTSLVCIQITDENDCNADAMCQWYTGMQTAGGGSSAGCLVSDAAMSCGMRYVIETVCAIANIGGEDGCESVDLSAMPCGSGSALGAATALAVSVFIATLHK